MKKGDYMKHIYLVEDEKPLNDLLKSYLVEAGYEVTPFYDGLMAREAIKNPPDLWILDIMLPGLDGYALIKQIKEITPLVPVIFMSARSADLDRVIGLEMGSDDYLPKPFLPRELVLRVQRLIKPARESEELEKNQCVPMGDAFFNRHIRALEIGDENYSLSNKEYDLLEFLLDNLGQAKSRSDILDSVWGIDYFGSERVIDDTLRRLRKKVPTLPIETVYGYGYILK